MTYSAALSGTLLAALLSPGVDEAHTLAVAETQADGWIYLMTHQGKCPQGRYQAIVTAPKKSIEGCWFPFDDHTVFVEWEDGSSILYPANGFVSPEKAPRKDI